MQLAAGDDVGGEFAPVGRVIGIRLSLTVGLRHLRRRGVQCGECRPLSTTNGDKAQ
jgi:hypothetical protein